MALSVDLTGSYFITSTGTAGIEVSLATLFSGIGWARASLKRSALCESVEGSSKIKDILRFKGYVKILKLRKLIIENPIKHNTFLL